MLALLLRATHADIAYTRAIHGSSDVTNQFDLIDSTGTYVGGVGVDFKARLLTEMMTNHTTLHLPPMEFIN